MFRCLLFLVAFSMSATIAEASNYWRSIGNGYHLLYTSSGQHDGWYYRVSHGRYCRHSRVPSSSVSYSANWKSDLVKALDKAKDTELFIAAIRESGLRVDQNSLPDTYGYARGHSTIYQGYAAQGQSILGLAAYAPSIGQVDIESLLRTQQRLAERQSDNASQANNFLTDRIGQVGELQTEVAKIQAAGAAIVASVQAASPPRTEVHQWERGSGSNSQQHSHQSQTQVERSPGPQSYALSVVGAQHVLDTKCVACHGPNKKSGGLDLSNFSTWDESLQDAYEVKIRERITTSDPAKKMPPVDKPQLAAADMKKLLNVLPD
jgi:mono/diheme cytochrome c family protein